MINLKNRESNFYEIKLNYDIVYDSGRNIATVQKCYVIANPPSDLEELLKKIEKNDKENPINYDFVDETLRKKHGNSIKIDKVIVQKMFYRETIGGMNRNWSETNGSWGRDFIENHTDDLIGLTIYSNKDRSRKYTVMKRKYGGEIIKEMSLTKNK